MAASPNLPLRIERATHADAALVHRLMLDAFREYDGVLDPRSSAHDETVDDVIAHMDLGGAVLAYAAAVPVGSGRYELRTGGVVYLGRLAVPKEFRGRGIAPAMIEFIETAAIAAGATDATLDCRMVLDTNILLYERLGYAVVSTYEHPRGAARVVTMEKRLA
jgi:GNAT superfamily N-acetyltransferase